MKKRSYLQKRGSIMVLFSAILYPVTVTLFLILVFPLICRPGDKFYFYNTLTALSLICVIPFISGLIMFVKAGEIPAVSSESGKNRIREVLDFTPVKNSALCAIFSFIIILSVILITRAVPTQGWLRSIYAALLLGFSSSFVCLLYSFMDMLNVKRLYFILISSVLVLTVPVGILCHHPWNYFFFVSPFYWIIWAWIIGSPSEGLLYGLIALILLSSAMVILLRRLKNRV